MNENLIFALGIILIVVLVLILIINFIFAHKAIKRYKNAIKVNDEKISSVAEKDKNIENLNYEIATLKSKIDSDEKSHKMSEDLLTLEINKLKENNSELATRLDGANKVLEIKISENELVLKKYNDLQDEYEAAINEANNNIETANATIIELSNEIENLKSKEQNITEKPKKVSYLKELKTKKRSELFALAKEYNLKGYSRLTNEALIIKINNAYKKANRKKNK